MTRDGLGFQTFELHPNPRIFRKILKNFYALKIPLDHINMPRISVCVKGSVAGGGGVEETRL